MRLIPRRISVAYSSSLGRRFVGGAAWSVFGAVLTSGINLLTLVVVARYLGKESYGKFLLIQSTLGSVGVLAGFGVGAAASKFSAEFRKSDTPKLARILALSERVVIAFSFFLMILLVVCSEWLSEVVLKSSTLAAPLSISAMAVFFTAIDGYQKSVLVGFEAMKQYFQGSVIGVLSGVPVMIFSASNFGLEGVCWSLVLSAMLQAFLSRFQMNRQLRAAGLSGMGENCGAEYLIIWKFAFPALLASSMLLPAHWSVNALLVRSSGGFGEVAVQGIAMQWFNLIMFVPGTAGRVVLPILTEHVSNKDHGGSVKIIAYAMAANALVALPVALAVAFFSSAVMEMYGQGFGDKNWALVIAVFVAVLVAVISPVGNLIAASSRMWLGFFMNAGWAAIYIFAAWFWIEFGAIGALSALALAYVFHSLWTVFFAFRYSRAVS